MAETECPWGEMAQNYRAAYLAAALQLALAGSDEAAAAARGRMNRIAQKLFG